jgi:archaellum biogenesis ATPase FlaH
MEEITPDIQYRPETQVVGDILVEKNQHNLLVYPHLESFRKIYPDLAKQMLKEGAIVVILTYYEPVSEVFENLRNVEIDVDEQRAKGNLIVADAVEQFFGKQNDILLFLLNLERKIKQIGKNYVSVIVNMSAFHLYDSEKEMVEYEGLFDLSEARNWKVLCCYHKADYDSFSEQVRQELIARHNRRLFVV